MSRLFEVKAYDGRDDVRSIIDLEKVCLVRVETEAGHHYPRLVVRFVDDHTVPPEAAKRFLDAYRAYLTGQPVGPPAEGPTAK